MRGRPKLAQRSAETVTFPTSPNPRRRLEGVGGTRLRDGGDVESGGKELR